MFKLSYKNEYDKEINLMKRYILCLLILLSSISSFPQMLTTNMKERLGMISTFSQKLTVEKMEALAMDTYASVHRRVDLNNNPCAVVRVSLPISGATFSGNVVGDVKRDGSDYLVYMPTGSKKLWVKHPNFHELEVVFGDYGIDRLQSVVTYRVTVNVQQAGTSPQKMQILNIKVTPSDAVVQIDGEVVDGNTITLSVGTHKYNVAARGYHAQEGAIEVKESSPAKLLIELDRKTTSSQNNTQVATTVQSIQVQQPVQQTVTNTFSPQTFTVKGVSFNMMPVEGGTFTMGEAKEMKRVTLSSYYIGETEVTQELWLAVMGNNPSRFTGNQNPVENVSWDNCQAFIDTLYQLTGKQFRLPTEAEWEFAARGGNKSRNTSYSGSDKHKEVAWCMGIKTHPVKTKKANELGIYDMSGNVWEWCQDWYGSYSSSPQTNPTGPSSGSKRVCRGGSWVDGYAFSKVASRSKDSQDRRCSHTGLRLALSE